MAAVCVCFDLVSCGHVLTGSALASMPCGFRAARVSLCEICCPADEHAVACCARLINSAHDGVFVCKMVESKAVASLSLMVATCLLSEEVTRVLQTFTEFAAGDPQLLQYVFVNLAKQTGSSAPPAFLTQLRRAELKDKSRLLTKTRLFTLGVVLAVLGALHSQEAAAGTAKGWRPATFDELEIKMRPILLGEPGSITLAACLQDACSGEQNYLTEELFQLLCFASYVKLRRYMAVFPSSVRVVFTRGMLVIHPDSLESVCIAASALLSSLNNLRNHKTEPAAALSFKKLWWTPMTATRYLKQEAKVIPVWPSGVGVPFIAREERALTEEEASPSPLDDDADPECPVFGSYTMGTCQVDHCMHGSDFVSCVLLSCLLQNALWIPLRLLA